MRVVERRSTYSVALWDNISSLIRKLNFDMTELTVRVLGPDDPDPTPQTYAARTSEKLKLTQPTLITYGSRKNGGVRQSRRIRQVKESGRKRKIAVLRNMTVKDVKITVGSYRSIVSVIGG